MLTTLITGANRGLGLAFVELYASSGWRVFACCRNPTKATELLTLAQRYPALISLFTLDVTKSTDIEKLVNDLDLASIDVLINNAGIYGPSGIQFSYVTEEPWLEVWRVNTVAPLMISQALVTNVATSQRRMIVNISSTMGSMEENTEGGAYFYRTSKAALNAITKSMAIDLAPQQITVVALNPGWVRTDMGGGGAIVSAKESATALKCVLDYVSLDESGRFFDLHGEEIPW
jgi:NAD(P)-dependent dehydrogenase (short-subunit alcohol dehydrogenase family)